MPDEHCTARDLARRSQAAVKAKDRAGWLSLFAPDAIVQDPIGPSPFNPDGAGHRGPEAIAAFYDTVIAPNDLITFEIEDSFLCGDEVADVGVIRTVLENGLRLPLTGPLNAAVWGALLDIEFAREDQAGSVVQSLERRGFPKGPELE